jgi:hypothetical protein
LPVGQQKKLKVRIAALIPTAVGLINSTIALGVQTLIEREIKYILHWLELLKRTAEVLVLKESRDVA